MNIRSNLVAAAAATFLATLATGAFAQTMVTPLGNEAAVTVADLISEHDAPEIDKVTKVQESSFIDDIRVPHAVGCGIFSDELDGEDGNFVIFRVDNARVPFKGRVWPWMSADVCTDTGATATNVQSRGPTTDGENWQLSFDLVPGDGRPQMTISMLLEYPEDGYKLNVGTRIVASYGTQEAP